MSNELSKLIVTTILNQGVSASEVKDWHFKVREVDGVYYVDLSTSVAISPKTQLTRKEKFGRFLIIAFVMSSLAAFGLGSVGMLLPDAYVGRDLVLISTAPAFVAQLIGARFLVRAYRRHQEGQIEKSARHGTGETAEGSRDLAFQQ